MAYIGNIPAEAYISISSQTFTTINGTSYTLSSSVESSEDIALFLNNVRQKPSTYTATGTSLTMSEATTTDDELYCVYLGKALQTVNPGADSVGTSQIADLAVTTAKLAGDAVTTAKILDDNVTTAKILDDNVTTAKILDGNVTTPKASFISTSSGAGVISKGTSGDSDGYVQLNCSENSHGIKLKSPPHSAAQSYTLTFPQTAPATDKYIQTDASGNLSFATVTEYDDDAIKNDIATLALHQATNANSAKYNLVNTNVDQFEDSSGVATFTNCARNAAGEFVSSVSETATNTAPPNQQITSRTGAPATSSWTGGGYTDDRISNGGGSYAGSAIDFAWDLSNDFTINKWWVDNSGDNQNKTYQGASLLITTDTSMTAGASPANLWDTSLSSSGEYQPDPSDWAVILDDTYATTIGASGLTDNTNDGTGDQSYNLSSGGAVVRHYWNSGTAYSGWKIVYTKATATMTMKAYVSGSFTTLSSDGEITMTNVPSAGRVYLACGDAAGGSTQYMATSYNGGSLTDYSAYTTTTENATGNFVSTATVANSSVSTMGAVITYKNNVGTNTLNTDIVLEVSADGGSNYTTATLVAGGTFSTGILQAVANDISVTAGTNIQYRISFANQSLGVKEGRIYGVSLQY